MTEDKSDNGELTALRQAIDDVDGKLLDLLLMRANLSRQVGQIKRLSADTAVYRPERERAVVERLLSISAVHGKGGLPPSHIEAIWREIFSSSRALQKPMRVAFLGPEGTFSHMAALESLGHCLEPCPKDDFHGVFRAVHDAQCEMGVLPLENTLHGSVGQNLDLFAGHAVHIVGEHYSRITHSLMSRETRLENVQKIYSHPQPFGQCAIWLRAHLPGVPLIPEESTAAAARRAAEEPGSAAIGHPGLADLLGLEVLADAIEDSCANWTRFVLIAPGSIPARTTEQTPDTALKTSLLLSVPDRPGSLSKVLELLADAGINMSKLESRPMRDVVWHYIFFVDTGGDLLRPEYADAMRRLGEVCQSVRVLGVYPHVQTP